MGRKDVSTSVAHNQGLSSKIGNTFIGILRKALIIVCVESIIIAGVLALMYIVQDNRSSVKEYTAEIDSAMQSKVSMLEAIAAGISGGTIQEKADVLAYVDAMVGMDDQVSAVYSCYDENITIMSGGWEPPADFIVTERDWYKAAQADPEHVYISDPYVDLQSGGICITLAKATYKDGKIAGVVGMDMYMDNLVSLIEKSYTSSSYVFLTTSEGTVLVHPNDQYSLTADSTPTLKDINSGRYQRFINKEMKIAMFLDYKGGFKLGIGKTSEVTGWKVIAVKPLYMIFLFFALIIGLNLIIYFVTLNSTKSRVESRISVLFKPLESISGKMIRVAEGDLSVVFDEEKNSTEIEKLTDSINETISSLKFYIERISGTVNAISDKNLAVTVDGEFKGSYVQIKDALQSIINDLNDSFVQIREETQQVLEFADELGKTTENVAESASLQNASVNNVSNDMAQLTEQTREITERAMSVRDNARTTKEHLEIGNGEMDELVKAMESIEDCYSQIADFVGEIQKIASQTNLLSLNASIEAARAGEAGKGFAVVADEISELAESSGKASQNISKLIKESLSAVEAGKELVTATSETILQGMNDSIESEEHMDAIVQSVENQQKAIEDVNERLKEVAELVENNAASAQENTAISQSLNECAQNLKNMADSFRLK